MADGGTNVGKASISLDFELGADLSKQIGSISQKITDAVTKAVKSSMGSMGQDMGKTVNKAMDEVSKTVTKASAEVGKDIGTNINKGVEKSMQGTEKAVQKTVEKINKQTKDLNVASFMDKEKAAVTPKASTDAQPRAPTTESVKGFGSRDEVQAEIDRLSQRLSGYTTLLEQARAKEAEIEKMRPYKNKEADLARLAVQQSTLSGQTTKLNADIAKLDSVFDNFDTIKAKEQTDLFAKEQEALAKAAQKVTDAEYKQQMQTERLAAAQMRTEATTEKLKQTKLKTAAAEAKASAPKLGGGSGGSRGGKGGGIFGAMTSGSKQAGKSMSMMGGFTKSLTRNLLGMNLILSLVSQGVRKLVTSLWGAMKTNSEFKNSLTQIKSNLATAFQPIFQAVMPAINAMMSGIAKATAYLAAFISMLFGKSVKSSNASAKAMASATSGVQGYTESMKEAEKITAGFDQLNDITESGNSGGGGGGGGADTGIVPVNIDEAGISNIQKALDKIKEMISKTFDAAPVQAFTSMATTFATQMYASWSRILGAIGTNVYRTMLAMAPAVSEGLNNVSELWTNVFTDIENFIVEWFPKITDEIVLFVDNVFATFKPFFVLLSEMWRDWTQIVKDLWDKWGADILGKLGEFITGIMDTFNKIWTHIIDPIIRPAIAFMKEIWETHLKDIIFQIGDFVGNAISRALELYNKFIKPIIDWLIVNLGPAFTATFGLIGGYVGGVLKGMLTTVGEVIGSIRKIFDGLMTFLEGVFSGDWKKVWQGMSDVFGGIFNGLKALFKAPINWIISGLNGFIKGLNKIKIPDWVPVVGGKGFSVGQIQMLANGGVLNKPTLNIAGEYPGAKSNPEIVTPQNIMRDTFKEVMAEFMAAMQSGNAVGSGTIDLVVNIGGKKLLDVFIDVAKEYERQTGKVVMING